MDVALTPELERFVAERVAAGRFRSADDVIREALHLLQTHEQEREAQLATLRADVDEGIAAAERGDVWSGEDTFASLRARRTGRTGM